MQIQEIQILTPKHLLCLYFRERDGALSGEKLQRCRNCIHFCWKVVKENDYLSNWSINTVTLLFSAQYPWAPSRSAMIGWVSKVQGFMGPNVYPEVPDGGWGWVVAVSFFLVEAYTYGIIKSFGIFLQDLMSYFGETNSRVSWIVSICVFVMTFTGEEWVLVPHPSRVQYPQMCKIWGHFELSFVI